MKVGKSISIKEQLFGVLLGWLSLVICVGLIGFAYGIMFSEAGYKLPVEDLSFITVFSMSIGIIVPIGLAWLQVQQTKRLIFRITPSNNSEFHGETT